MMQKTYKMTEIILAHVCSSESTQRELSNEYQHDRVSMIFKNLCVPVLWSKVASAMEGLNQGCPNIEVLEHRHLALERSKFWWAHCDDQFNYCHQVTL